MKSILKLGCLALVTWQGVTTQAAPTVTQIATGGTHSLFVKSDGSLWTMGDNGYGQLGIGSAPQGTNGPQQIVSSGVTAIAAGGDSFNGYSLFVKSDHSLWAMGYNAFGQLGDGTTTNHAVPELIVSNQVTLIAAGNEHSLLLKFHGPAGPGSFWDMGRDLEGELGDGTTNLAQVTPEQILSTPFGSVVAAIAAGGNHSLFVKPDGSLWGMGDNQYGQLGDGTITDRLYPVESMSSNVSAIAAGVYHSLIITSDGGLLVMGLNQYGQLGDGYTTDSLVPRGIGVSGVTAVAAGYFHSLFLKSDGSLWGMGYNNSGQLGDGTTIERDYPVEIVSSNVTAIAAGGFHSLFIKSDGSLWGMGDNYDGELGDGTTYTERNFPVQIFPTAVSNGSFENGDFFGWTPDAEFSLNENFVSDKMAFVHSGIYGAALGQVGSLGSLFQSLPTVPGAKYLLSFWLDSPDGETPNEFLASWNGSNLLDETNLAATGWTHYQIVVTATGSSAVLKFGFRDDKTFLGLDDIYITQIEQPRITGITVFGANLVFNANNGLSGRTYFTLMNTNMANPLNQWSPVATNLLSADGNFTITVTNTVDHAVPQRFYVLQLQ